MARILLLILIHTLADYFLQGKKLSRMKAFKPPYLFAHVGTYTLLFIILSPILLGLTFTQGLIFSLINGSFHLVIDYITGKYKLKFFNTDDTKYYITSGLDHVLHLIILIASYVLLYPDAMNTSYSSYFN